jgi:hypothetical protein
MQDKVGSAKLRLVCRPRPEPLPSLYFCKRPIYELLAVFIANIRKDLP